MSHVYSMVHVYTYYVCDQVLGLVVEPGLYRSPAFRLYLLVAAADLAATLSLFIPFQVSSAT